MSLSTFDRWLIFFFVSVIFLPFTSKVVRLASTTWDNRQYLEPERIKQVVFLTPLLLIISFFLVYFGIIFVIDVLVF